MLLILINNLIMSFPYRTIYLYQVHDFKFHLGFAKPCAYYVIFNTIIFCFDLQNLFQNRASPCFTITNTHATYIVVKIEITHEYT